MRKAAVMTVVGHPRRLLLSFAAGCLLTLVIFWTLPVDVRIKTALSYQHQLVPNSPSPSKNEQALPIPSNRPKNEAAEQQDKEEKDGDSFTIEDYFLPQLHPDRLVTNAGTGPGNNILRAFYDSRVRSLAVLFVQNYFDRYNCLPFYTDGDEPGALINGSFAKFNMFDRRLLYCNSTAAGTSNTSGGMQIPKFIKVLPYNITAVNDTSKYHKIPVGNLDWPTEKRQPMAICLSTLFGERISNWLSIIQFIEFYRLQGVSKIFVYYHSSGNEVKRILRHYARRNVTETVLWPGPPACTDFYYCQNAMVNDCLYRTVNRFKYAAFIDYDELALTASGKPIPVALDRIDTSEYCSFNMKPRWFVRDEWDPPFESFNADSLKQLESLATFTGITMGSPPVFDNHMPKTIIKPDKITAMFIHHYDSKVGDCHKALDMPQNLMVFRHYRMKKGWGSFYNQTLAMGPYFRQPPPKDGNLSVRLIRNIKEALQLIFGFRS